MGSEMCIRDSHKSHHTMNAMGHDVPTMLGVDQRDLAGKLSKLIPGYMAMGQSGMHEMSEMEMPLPDNTLPMMGGDGPFGPVGMGGMFSVLKVRRGQKRGDYGDPGWYRHPPGTVAREVPGGPAGDTPRAHGAGHAAMPAAHPPASDVEVQVRKPRGHAGH